MKERGRNVRQQGLPGWRGMLDDLEEETGGEPRFLSIEADEQSQAPPFIWCSRQDMGAEMGALEPWAKEQAAIRRAVQFSDREGIVIKALAGSPKALDSGWTEVLLLFSCAVLAGPAPVAMIVLVGRDPEMEGRIRSRPGLLQEFRCRLMAYSRQLALRQRLVEAVDLHGEMLGVHDPLLPGHLSRVSRLSFRLGRKQGLGPEALEELVLAALLHDMGKLFASGKKRCTAEGGSCPPGRGHAPRGGELAAHLTAGLGYGPELARMIQHHHERWDGSGFPGGLRGEEISLGTRILSVCDAADAMGSRPVGQGGIGAQKVIGELRRASGTQFDPELVEPLIALLSEEPGTVGWLQLPLVYVPGVVLSVPGRDEPEVRGTLLSHGRGLKFRRTGGGEDQSWSAGQSLIMEIPEEDRFRSCRLRAGAPLPDGFVVEKLRRME